MVSNPWMIPLESNPLFVGKRDSLGPAAKFGGAIEQPVTGLMVMPASWALRAVTPPLVPTGLKPPPALAAALQASTRLFLVSVAVNPHPGVPPAHVTGGVANSVLPTE